MSASDFGSAKEFWAAVRAQIPITVEACSKTPEIPFEPYRNDKQKGFCYIISVQVGNIILPGQISCADCYLASQRITEGSHRLLTVEEWRRYDQIQQQNKKMLDRMETDRKKTVTMEVLK